MKKFFGYFFVVAAGAIGVYFCLCKMNKIDKQSDVIESASEIKEEKVVVPSRDDFINEATKLQVLAENKNGNAAEQVSYFFARTPAAALGICNPTKKGCNRSLFSI